MRDLESRYQLLPYMLFVPHVVKVWLLAHEDPTSFIHLKKVQLLFRLGGRDGVWEEHKLSRKEADGSRTIPAKAQKKPVRVR